MKSRFIKLGAIFMAAMTAVCGSGTVTTQAASIRAGVSAALAECLNGNTKMTMSAKGDVNFSRTVSAKNVSQEEKDAEKKR